MAETQSPIEVLNQVIDLVVAQVPWDSRTPAAARKALAEVEAVVAALEHFRITYGPNEHFIQCGGSHNIPPNPATYPITRCEQAQAALVPFGDGP